MKFCCSCCVAWEQLDVAHMDDAMHSGICKQNSPSVDAEGKAVWPITRHDHWCMQFLSKELMKSSVDIPMQWKPIVP